MINQTLAAYPDSYCLHDKDVEPRLGAPAGRVCVDPIIAANHVMATTFTSGSTGRSEPHPKRWGELVAGALLAERRFGCVLAPGTSVVATVPPQHMYGLETTIMLPLVAGLTLDAGRPFYAADIADALALVPPPRLLVTTPAHLRVAVDAGLDWPELRLVLSATAPLSRRLAGAAEHVFAAPVMEIYGCTEAGSIASRRTVADDLWTLYDGMNIKGGRLVTAHLSDPVDIADRIEMHADGRFALLGRHQDVVNIAGKRTSLAYLNAVLNDVDGVLDGAFVVQDTADERSTRLMALVVAPSLDRAEIAAALARRIDPLFLPRPLILVDRLPRNDTGKLPCDDLSRGHSSNGRVGDVNKNNIINQEAEVEVVVADDHPALAGHFPGEPLVPGVVVLDCVAAVAEKEFGACRLVAIPAVKFLAPVRPDERFLIALRRCDTTGIAFECRRQTTILVRGRMIWAS